MTVTTKFCLAAVLAGVAAGTGAARAAPDGAALVERTARDLVQQQAERDGLVEPRLVLEVVSTQRPSGVCAELPTIAATDTRHVARMRFTATCASGNWREEYTVRGELSALVVVAATRVAANEPITEDALRMERRNLPNPREALSDPAAVVGQASRRALQPGQLVERRTLAPAVLVRRGATVRIVARNGGIVATSEGQATATGHRDDIIGVRNTSTGRLIRARVTGIDEVEPASIGTPQPP